MPSQWVACSAGLTAASDGSLAALSAQAAEHLGRTVQLKEAAGTPRIFAGFASLQTGLEAIQTLLEQLMHVNVSGQVQCMPCQACHHY